MATTVQQLRSVRFYLNVICYPQIILLFYICMYIYYL